VLLSHVVPISSLSLLRPHPESTENIVMVHIIVIRMINACAFSSIKLSGEMTWLVGVNGARLFRHPALARIVCDVISGQFSV